MFAFVRSIVRVSAFALLIAPLARAQFPGDVFFTEPSIAAPEGGVGEFEIMTFTGTRVLGAAHLEITCDPALAEIESASPALAPELATVLGFGKSSGKGGVVVANDRSKSSPFGLVTLARVRIKPKVAAGSIVNFQIVVRDLLDENGVTYPAKKGFGGQLVVTSPISTASSSSEAHVFQPLPIAFGELERLAPAGTRISFFSPVRVGGVVIAHRTEVIVAADPKTPREAANPQ